MAYTLNKKLAAFPPYTPSDEDPKLIHMYANECAMNLPADLVDRASKEVLGVQFHRYPDAYAKDLREAFAAFYGLSAGCVTAGNGSDELIGLFLSAFLMKGETFLTTEPDFSMYTFYPHLSEVPVVLVEKGEDLTLSAGSLIEQAKASNARLVLFSNPCNPTSVGLPRKDVLRIVEALPDTLVVVDEAYMDFWEEDQSVLGEVGAYDNLAVLKTCSKMGLAALRLGFAVTNPRLTQVLQTVKSVYNINTLTQRIATLVLREESALRNQIAKTIASRRALSVAVAAREKTFPGLLKLYPSCTNFLTLRMPDPKGFAGFLLSRGISVRYFPQLVRVTAGTTKENDAFMTALDLYLEGESSHA